MVCIPNHPDGKMPNALAREDKKLVKLPGLDDNSATVYLMLLYRIRTLEKKLDDYHSRRKMY